jgi:hypothetical protein
VYLHQLRLVGQSGGYARSFNSPGLRDATVVAEHAASPGRSAVARALWTAFLGGLRTQALCVAAAGTLTAAAASTRLQPDGLERRPRLGTSLAGATGSTRPRRAASALALIAGGAAAVLEPASVLTIGVTAAGLIAVYAGVELLLSLIALDPVAKDGATLRLRRLLPRSVPVALGGGALAGALALVATGGADGAPAVPPMTCNGYIQLCDRRLNDVALAATHNAMGSVTIPNWLFGQQDGNDQPAASVRHPRAANRHPLRIRGPRRRTHGS